MKYKFILFSPWLLKSPVTPCKLIGGFGRVPFNGVYKGYYKGSRRVLLRIGCKLNFSTFGVSYKVVDSESFNFDFLGF